MALPSLLFLPIAFEVISGNVHLLYAAAIVVGFRWPAAWALMFLTKATPGIGVLWFLVRREWRSLAVALGRDRRDRRRLVRPRHDAVGALDRHPPGRRVGRRRGGVHDRRVVPPDRARPRLVAAAAIVVVAAWTDRRWLLPVGVVLAMPVVWLNSLAVLAACVPLWQAERRRVPGPDSAAAAARPATVAG